MFLPYTQIKVHCCEMWRTKWVNPWSFFHFKEHKHIQADNWDISMLLTFTAPDPEGATWSEKPPSYIWKPKLKNRSIHHRQGFLPFFFFMFTTEAWMCTAVRTSCFCSLQQSSIVTEAEESLSRQISILMCLTSRVCCVPDERHEK